MRPAGSKFSLRSVQDPVLDAWKGAAQWARTEEAEQFWVTRAEYEECGGDYLKEHTASNPIGMIQFRAKKKKKKKRNELD